MSRLAGGKKVHKKGKNVHLPCSCFSVIFLGRKMMNGKKLISRVPVSFLFMRGRQGNQPIWKQNQEVTYKLSKMVFGK